MSHSGEDLGVGHVIADEYNNWFAWIESGFVRYSSGWLEFLSWFNEFNISLNTL